VSDKQGKDLANQYYDQEAEDYIAQYTDRYDKYPSNLVRIKMISKRLKKNGVRTVLDVGCGTAGPMIKLLNDGFDVYGLDFAESMVEVGKQELIKAGHDPSRIWVADLEKDMSGPVHSKYDAILALGVFPHVLDEQKALRDMRPLLNDGGMTFISFRNYLFGSFTFNNYSMDLFLNKLMDLANMPADLKSDVASFLAEKNNIDGKQVRKGEELVYNDILAKMHNPFTIANVLYEPCGFDIEEKLFYHFHAVPPVFRKDNPKLFDELSLKMEDPFDWRGHFMASAFVAEARMK